MARESVIEKAIGGVLVSGYVNEPALTPHCHASTLAQTRAGTLIAAWFGGSAEGAADVGIWLARRENGRWQKAIEVANGAAPGELPKPAWNPVLFQPSRGPLQLFYKVGTAPEVWQGMVKSSNDDGRTWSSARRLPAGILGPVKNKPVELAGGLIISPCSEESADVPSKWRIYFEYSRDSGISDWTRSDFINDGKQIAAVQPSLLIHGDGRLQAVGRTLQGKTFSTFSVDGGQNWEPLQLLQLPNPDSGIDALTLADGRHIIVYNHNTNESGSRPAGRTPLNVALSDNGLDWRCVAELENGPGEFSYPAVIQSADGIVHIAYTWNRESIKHIALDPQRF